eukprot:5429-Heterococcus_DN1.PRE.1
MKASCIVALAFVALSSAASFPPRNLEFSDEFFNEEKAAGAPAGVAEGGAGLTRIGGASLAGETANGDTGSANAKNLAAAKAEKANTAAADSEKGKKAASESAKHWSKALNANLNENEAKKYHEVEASHTKEKQATLQYKEKYAAAAKKYAKHLSKQAQQAAAKAAQAAKEEQAAKKSLEA